jgi:dipeptidyl aminopeptidase/acylaminoacyl peptidase
VHGGPLASWNAWSWRWNPWLMAAQGYAVLLPDPALSTGYGLDHVRASWGDWGGAAYTDVLQLTDAALTRGDLDSDRTAMMGGSFGGYMANWIAGHTDRFRAIVTHASLWGLERFSGTTDGAYYWQREMTPEMIRKNDPSAHLAQVDTPMLVIHGDKDYRVPVGEALALWWDLCSQAPDPEAMPHRFLYFPDENHWVLTPGHAVVWYEVVLSFLSRHVREGEERLSSHLG